MGVGHRARLEPAVENLRGSAIDLPIPLDDDVVDDVLVEIIDGNARQTPSALRASRHRSCPRGSSTLIQTGIHEPQNRLRLIFQSFASRSQFPKRFEPTFSGTQSTWSLIRTQILSEILDLHVPGLDRAIDEGRVGPFAKWIAMDDRILVDELSFIFQPS